MGDLIRQWTAVWRPLVGLYNHAVGTEETPLRMVGPQAHGTGFLAGTPFSEGRGPLKAVQYTTLSTTCAALLASWYVCWPASLLLHYPMTMALLQAPHGPSSPVDAAMAAAMWIGSSVQARRWQGFGRTGTKEDSEYGSMSKEGVGWRFIADHSALCQDAGVASPVGLWLLTSHRRPSTPSPFLGLCTVRPFVALEYSGKTPRPSVSAGDVAASLV